MRNEIGLSNEEIEAAFDAAFQVGVCLDPAYGVDVTFTRDTLDNFAESAAAYASHAGVNRTATTIEIVGAQVRKGDPRRDVRVIDFGSVRAVYA